MEFTSQTLVPGVRFSPNDQQLVQHYLYPKVTKSTTSAPVRDCDLYAYQPLQIWNEFHRIQGEDVFLFTKLKKKSPSNATRKIAGGPASWRREDNGKDFTVTIDNCSITATRKIFSYRNPETGHHGCRWTMYEYSLPSLSEVTVLCQLRKSRTQKTRKLRRHAGGVDDATNTMSQQARVGEGYHQQQITAVPAETESEIPNRARLDNMDKFLQNDDIDNDQMDVSPKELEDLIREFEEELLSPDLADGLPSIQTTPEADANISIIRGSRK